MVRLHLDALLTADEVALHSAVRVELAAGTSPQQVQRLLGLLNGVHTLDATLADWQRAESMALTGASRGERFGAADLVIAATATRLGAAVWSADGDFARMERLGLCRVWRPGDCV